MSGMQVATARLARSAYRVANLNAPESSASSERSSVAERPSAPSALSDAFRMHNFQGPTAGSNTDMAFEAIEQIQAVHAFRANVAMLQADDERYGSLLDIRV